MARLVIMVLLLSGVGPFASFSSVASAAEFGQRQLQLSNSVPGQTSTYRVSFSIPTAGPLGSILVEFCDNTALFVIVCNPPPGLDVSGATLSAQTGETGFVINPLTTANRLILSRVPAATPGGVPVAYTLDGVQNAAADGSQFARYSTYATNNATGAYTDSGAVAYSLNQNFMVSAEVPPYLLFCLGITIAGIDCNTAAGDYINMGDFVTTRASTGQTQMVVATNADGGYIVNVGGATMSSGNNVIPALASPTFSAPGTSQFGINLRANSNPAAGQEPDGSGVGVPAANYNQPNRFYYSSGDVIASHNNVEDFRKYTVTYLVNIGRSQPPGVYSSTFTYTAIGNF